MIKQTDQKEPPGWKGNVYYPDGFNGHGFGIDISPGGKVSFPMLKADGEKVQDNPQLPISPLLGPVPKLKNEAKYDS